MMGLGFLFKKKILARLKKGKIFALTTITVFAYLFCYENKLTFPISISNQKFEDSMDLLLVTDGDKSNYVHIKDFGRFMFNKTYNKKKKYFCKSCLKYFSCKKVLTKHKDACLSTNDAQSVRLEKGTTEFKNHFKQIPVPLKI